tara:strand:+ start:802 stop:1608 length:807 start_codon:yes stop_codon:yes gene_type:complete
MVSAHCGQPNYFGLESSLEATTRICIELGDSQNPILLRWANWRESRQVMYAFHSYALFTAEGVVIVDPVYPIDSSFDQLVDLFGGVPTATVLTNDMHERDAYKIRDDYGTPVWAPEAAVSEDDSELEGVPDYTFAEEDSVPGGVSGICIDGRFVGDTIIQWKPELHSRILFTGDALNGPDADPTMPSRKPHPRSTPGLYMGAGRPYLQHSDLDAMKVSLHALLKMDFDSICGAHGHPIMTGAKGALGRLLAIDWDYCVKKGQFPRVDV